MASSQVSQMQRLSTLCALTVLLAAGAAAQTSSSSSSSQQAPSQHSSDSQPRAGQPEAGGAAITLETSEPLFDLATGLNACGYDADLANSHPVRAEVRADVAAAVAASPEAKASQQALCSYFQEHELNDKGRELAQYVSLALYLSPAPKLAPIADETEMPPDALAVVNVLPLIRTFAEKVALHAIWLKHRAEYEAITDKVHDPITQAVLGTNIYLKVPVSSYDGRRLLILVEPMLAPNTPNARIYSSDYIVVTSPTTAGAIRMDQIRHLYLHYTIEPLVYARAASMQRLTPLLKPVQDAPLDYVYKTDVVALLTECLIKAIEARTMDVGFPAPTKPTGTRARTDLARYDEELATYDRQAEVIRRKQVDLDMRQGWVMVEYFYNQLLADERNPDGLSERMGQMVYGMDVGRERHHAEQIQFLPQGSGEFVRRAPRQPTGMMLAEKKMLEGDLDGAMAIAEKGLADPKQDHAEAMYVKARVNLMEGDPKTSQEEFEEVLKTSTNPRTSAWAHIYLGRLYDIKEPTERNHALEQYKAALAVTGVTPDARAAADKGLKTPFTVPKIVHKEDEEPLDPSGKKEKESYKPE
jgi:hypothetical protein